MRNWIRLFENIGIDQLKIGKFWYDAKTNEVHPIVNHHAVAAFDIPALKSIIMVNTAYTKDFLEDALAGYSGDGERNDQKYLEAHEEIVPLLLAHGFIRGNAGTYPDRNLSLEFFPNMNALHVRLQ